VLVKQVSVEEHEVLSTARTSAGQLSLVPVQYSAGSQLLSGSTVGRHTVVALYRLSIGQVEEFPGQYSAMSQSPLVLLHTVADVMKWHEASQHPVFGGSQSS
jgi:hypothetical protein